MSFQQGLSGLAAAARNLDVIGNNVANSNTVGAKSSRAEFADVYANSLYGAGNSFFGIGVDIAAIHQQFTQGDISTTNNPLDMAINGRGFFRMSDNGTLTYTRNGQFLLDKNGYITNAQGSRLTGFPADANGKIAAGVPGDLRLTTGDIAPKASSEAALSVNLDARETTPTAAFSLTDSTSYSGATSMAVYDTQGQEHTVALYFRNTGANSWDVFASADGTQVGAAAVGNLSFGTDGKLVAATSTTPLSLTVPVGAAAGGNQTIAIDLSKMTQFGTSFSVSELTQNGYATGRLAGFSISPDGTILARYSNGQTQAQGQVALANFVNPQGLQPLGGNQWAETAASGQPLVGAPDTGSLGVLQAGAVEQSNVDLTAELVNMITAQRAYQANAQTVRTQDQVLQTIVNLR